MYGRPLVVRRRYFGMRSREQTFSFHQLLGRRKLWKLTGADWEDDGSGPESPWV